MEEWLLVLTKYVVLAIDVMALIVIAFGSVQAFVASLGGMFNPLSGPQKRDIWLRYARSLVAGLTFQLAADVLESAITQDWQALARLAAIAVIRTFLSYFLERDVSEIRARQHQGAETPRS
jgi:uncharacterized membrane protein